MRYWVLGNWKSNGSLAQVQAFTAHFSAPNSKELVCGLALPTHLLIPAQLGPLWLGAQNVSPFGQGAYTGEVNADMLVEAGTQFCLVGHSERRAYFKESVARTAEKLTRLASANLVPVLCIGETLSERKAGKLEAVLRMQLKPLKALVKKGAIAKEKLVIAYEPVWAIGTGEAASPEDVAATHQLIRTILVEQGLGTAIPILYGGSVKPAFAEELARIEAVSGFLVGNASLEPQSFAAIIQGFCSGKHLFG